ncbi:MAG: antitoxin VapB family protein [Candidatus Lokiarchaeota archaeon]|nr:antitoxin VapB family protein [Candidatus Lokiarchaeota archaeon]
MTSKNISITKDVYDKLLKIKNDNESFSDLFLRLLRVQKSSLEKTFGAWDLSKEEKNIWDRLTIRNGRSWNKSDIEEIK